MKKKTKAPRKPGHPTDFEPRFCQMLIDWMAEGRSYETFIVPAGVKSRATLYNWEKIPEFLDAKRVAFAHCQIWWEDHGRTGLYSLGKAGPNINATVWIFNMKNRFNWVDRREVTSTIDAKVETKSSEQKEMVDELKAFLKTDINERRKA